MKNKFTCLIIGCVMQAIGALAQGIPQYRLHDPNNSTSIDTPISTAFSPCGNSKLQSAYDPSWFAPALPQQGTITDIFFRLPRRRDSVWTPSASRTDTILANSPIIGFRIKMTVTNYPEIYSVDSCLKVKQLTTVFNTPVYYVPAALQGDDTTKCWVRLALATPFSYDLQAPLENDTSGYRNIVVEFIADSNTVNTMGYNPAKNTSYFFPMSYGEYGSHLNLKSTYRIMPNGGSCNKSTPCAEGGNFPIIGFNLAPNSITEVPAGVKDGIYPNPVGNEGRLYFKPGLLGKPYKLYSLTGSLMAGGISSAEGIDMKALPAGIYLLYCGRERYKVVK